MVVLTSRILARVLVINGLGYVEKFADKTGGFVIMRYRLKRWWNETSLWLACFSILFGQDIASIDFKAPFDIFSLLTAYTSNGSTKVVYPGILPVIVTMLENGLRNNIRNQENPDSPVKPQENRVGRDEESRRLRAVSLNVPDKDHGITAHILDCG